MSSFTERATWTENPFVFTSMEPVEGGPFIDIETIPLHKALYDKLVKLVIPSPRSKTDPWSDKGRREWTPYDPVTKVDPSTIAPGLVEGMPLQSRRRKEKEGTGGKATFLNLVVDVSGSMGSPMGGGGGANYSSDSAGGAGGQWGSYTAGGGGAAGAAQASGTNGNSNAEGMGDGGGGGGGGSSAISGGDGGHPEAVGVEVVVQITQIIPGVMARVAKSGYTRCCNGQIV